MYIVIVHTYSYTCMLSLIGIMLRQMYEQATSRNCVSLDNTSKSVIFTYFYEIVEWLYMYNENARVVPIYMWFPSLSCYRYKNANEKWEVTLARHDSQGNFGEKTSVFVLS